MFKKMIKQIKAYFLIQKNLINIRRKGFEIKKYEYVIDPEHPSSKDYEVYYKGKLLRDVRGVIRFPMGISQQKNKKCKCWKMNQRQLNKNRKQRKL